MNVWHFLLLMGGLLIAAILTLFWHPQRSRTKTSTFVDRGCTDAVFRDDDRYWYGGVFYNNPDDPAVFVPKRFGLGWTMNFGHPRAKLVLLGMLLLVLLPPPGGGYPRSPLPWEHPPVWMPHVWMLPVAIRGNADLWYNETNI